MNNDADCERARFHLMAAVDGEAVGDESTLGTDSRQHLAACPVCSEWLRELKSLDHRLQRVTYADASVDVWPGIESALRPLEAERGDLRWLYLMAGIVLGWRALQLFVDLPRPFVAALVPLAVIVVALWQLARDPLAIQTFAPELQKRGV